LRNCNSEKVIKSNKQNTTFEIIQNLRYDNMSRQEKESILKDLITKLNIESPSRIGWNIVNISYMSENGKSD